MGGQDRGILGPEANVRRVQELGKGQCWPSRDQAGVWTCLQSNGPGSLFIFGIGLGLLCWDQNRALAPVRTSPLWG